jgi:hypothetical protein
VGVPGGGNVDLYPGVDYYDQFTDIDGVSLDAHIPNKPITSRWFKAVGDWDISGNKARSKTLSSSQAIATLNTSMANAVISCILNTPSNGWRGFAVRYADKTHCIVIGVQNNIVSIILWNGTSTVPASTTISPVLINNTDHVLEVTLSGTSISATVDGGFAVSATSSLNQTVGTHGLYSEAANCLFDDVQVVGL